MAENLDIEELQKEENFDHELSDKENDHDNQNQIETNTVTKDRGQKPIDKPKSAFSLFLRDLK